MTVAITPRDQAEHTVRVDIKTEHLVLIGASGITGVEQCTVAAEDGLGNQVDVVVEAEALVLDIDNNVTHLRGPGQYYITKPVTASDAHVYLYAPAHAEVDIQLES